MKQSSTLDVTQVLKEFEKAERSTAHRKSSFRIDVPFERALSAILRAKASRLLISASP